jgi:circadian clock protein KaiC
LTQGETDPEMTEVGISSIMDTWVLLRNDEEGRRRVRSLRVVKSRGMAHSDLVHPFHITDHGIRLDEDDPPSDRA